MFAAWKGYKNILSEVKILRSQTQGIIYMYENELYELKYSFLKDTLENVKCVMPCKAKKKL